MSIEILNGNELIVQGGLEAGFNLYTGYPGSPLADYFNILYKRKDEFQAKGIRVAIANSEANAAAMASGAKQAGRDCLVAMKSMGLHVASDALSVGNFANPGATTIDEQTGEEIFPGVVIAVGDDPWSMSTSTPADSRYLYKHLHIPFLEPSTPQELKDWMALALQISKRTSVYQGLLLTTYMAEGGGRVEVKEHKVVDGSIKTLDPSTFDLSKNVMVPPNSLKADVSMIEERFPKVVKVLNELKLDQILGNSESKIGFISTGVVYETLKQVLEEGSLLGHFSLYKIACSYPLADAQLLDYLKGLDTLVVVEEKRGFLENELKSFCSTHDIKLKFFGKEFSSAEGFPSHGGLSYEIVLSKVKELLGVFKLDLCSDLKHEFSNLDMDLPRRLPTFCPGCPHRETLSLLKDLRSVLKDQEGLNLLSHGDVGCYSLSFLPPFKEMHNLSAMGQGGALGAGVDIFSDNPSVVLMGDSTFFHSGLTDISNSLQLGHNITYILLDNDNTAMTGHQMTPASGISVEGIKRPRQNMLSVVQGLGVTQSFEVNPSDRYFYKNLLLDIVHREGVKVIVSNKECGLTFHGRQKSIDRKTFASNKTVAKKEFYQINTSVCEDCRECVENTGCPGLTQIHGAYGTKVAIDPQICVADSYCTKIKACPSFELVEVSDYHPTKYKDSKKISVNLDSIELPKPLKSFEDIANGRDWRMVVTGVGGSGVTTISRVVSYAAVEMNGRDDLDFKFMDQKGLAQRNGNVTGHLTIFKKGQSRGAVTPLGTADLLVSPDLLDASGQLQFLGENSLAIIDKNFQIPLSILLDDGVNKPTLTETQLRAELSNTLGDRVTLSAMKSLCNDLLGKSVYASAMILGVAFQSGALPFTFENMKKAFSETIRKEELEANWQAFNLGRKVYLHGDQSVRDQYFKKSASINEVALLKKSILESFCSWQKKDFFVELFENSHKKLSTLFPNIKNTHLAHYLHDQYIYNRGVNIQDFLMEARKITEFLAEDLWPLALRTLAKTYWVKDEVFVSHQMISPLQKSLDDLAYGKLGKRYKKTFINRPGFDIFGKTIEFDISPKPWMLRTMRHFRLLRFILPAWHRKERKINQEIRAKLNEIYNLEQSQQYSALKRLENIKGYREVLYKKAELVL
ncbi:thiamine pyrophosphate-dependent enzyme [Halobacteriovorax sp. HLS]|uniref:thiamine pyrophosphate-dependent enzyme n=1 Tax=Halobacteriovorax sp. HLS TaxID=2234000 RepID=UPI000FD76176|nr:thiamine pyrophosphate-dependent enzyme [Halobacteriovorax sp. HLS]